MKTITPTKIKNFQKQDLARAALHHGLIKSWDTGLGKSWAAFLFALLKVGYTTQQVRTADGKFETQIVPKSPVLLIAPGDLHQQLMNEGWDHFRIRVHRLSCQADFLKLADRGDGLPKLTSDGRPIIPNGYYITSYTELATNGVAKYPDVEDRDPRALLVDLCLHPDGRDGVSPSLISDNDLLRKFFEGRENIWKDAYQTLQFSKDGNRKMLDEKYQRRMAQLRESHNPEWAEQEMAEVEDAYQTLLNLVQTCVAPIFSSLNNLQQDFVIREFLRRKMEEYAANDGVFKDYPIGEPPPGFIPGKPETDTRPKWRVKCVYSESLADLSCRGFKCVVVDEGVKMKGANTLIGEGVRMMDPDYRLVLTATPIKNRLPDIFWLAWWSTGGKMEPHARFPYRGEVSEQTKFAETFMVSENNLSKEEKSRERGEFKRFKKLTPEVCNVHRLWKLLGPIVLRRRKQDCGEDIVKKIRKVIRCDMGTEQHRVYQYHLNAEYIDKNDMEAIGAKLQALRLAAAAPTSPLLQNKGEVFGGRCSCVGRDGVSPSLSCPLCKGSGQEQLPYVSSKKFIPKLATALTLIKEILERKEQVLVGSAFNDPLDDLGALLDEAGIRYSKLDGRVSQKKRGDQAAIFKKGRFSLSGEAASGPHASVPVMLAGVECMAEGHSFHLANNVILICYSWAYDKFKQFLDRVHRMVSVKDVNVYVIICEGSIDRKLESLVQEKGDAAELVLDGQLMGERADEVNLVELLKIARREFDPKTKTIDETALQKEWPKLRDDLQKAFAAWTDGAPVIELGSTRVSRVGRVVQTSVRPVPASFISKPTEEKIIHLEPEPENIIELPQLQTSSVKPETQEYTPNEAWRLRMKERAARLRVAQKADLWAEL